jgi:sugar/nucleoside kinase (ribokinase family)
VNVDHVIIAPKGPTGLSLIFNRGTDRAILTYLGLIPSLSAKDISDNLLSQSRHLHVASYFLQEALQSELPDLFTRAHALGLTTSLDTNYDPSGKWEGVNELLTVTDVFLPNGAEACSLTKAATPEAAAELLAGRVKTLAVKLGVKGALGVSGSQKAKANSIPLDVVDTVGAGDSFNAGFIYGYLQGWPLEKTLHAAAICGSLSTRAAGGTAAQATISEILAYL